jgi:hypothetical protein
MTSPQNQNPSVVLVHGAYADGSWTQPGPPAGSQRGRLLLRYRAVWRASSTTPAWS